MKIVSFLLNNIYQATILIVVDWSSCEKPDRNSSGKPSTTIAVDELKNKLNIILLIISVCINVADFIEITECIYDYKQLLMTVPSAIRAGIGSYQSWQYILQISF